MIHFTLLDRCLRVLQRRIPHRLLKCARYGALSGTLALTAAITACSEAGPASPQVEGVNIREMILVAGDGSVVYSHKDHWHGAPVVRAGAEVVLDLHFTAFQSGSDDHTAPPVEQWFRISDKSPAYNVRVNVEDESVASWNGSADRGSLRGLKAGASRISFVVRRGNATMYEAPPLNFRVQP